MKLSKSNPSKEEKSNCGRLNRNQMRPRGGRKDTAGDTGDRRDQNLYQEL